MRLLVIVVALSLGAAANVLAADIKSISRLAAGPGNTLFVADWKAARVHAITLAEAAQGRRARPSTSSTSKRCSRSRSVAPR